MTNKVTYEEVLELPNKPDIFFVDVRELNEIESTGLIPGSKHIPLGQITDVITKMSEEDFKKQFGRGRPKKDTEIVFTCRSGRRALVAVEEMAKLGYDNCRYYLGSWLEWESRKK